MLTSEAVPEPTDASSPPPSTLDPDPVYFTTWRNIPIRKSGPCKWPCNHPELERQEAQHWLLRLLLGYPYLGPVDQVLKSASMRGRAKVLDIATGVGVWCVDVAERFPFVEIVGIDNAPIQWEFVPSNCEFDLIDLEDELPYEPSSFDVIHLRFASMRVSSFSDLLTSAWQLLRPNGLLLIFDSDPRPILSDGSTPLGVTAWSDAFSRSLRKAGLAPFDVMSVVETFRNEELVGSDMRVPIGHGEGRMGQLGKIHVVNTKAYLDSARYVMLEYGEYTDAEVDILCQAYMADVASGQLYTRYHAFSIRKRHTASLGNAQQTLRKRRD